MGRSLPWNVCLSISAKTSVGLAIKLVRQKVRVLGAGEMKGDRQATRLFLLTPGSYRVGRINYWVNFALASRRSNSDLQLISDRLF